MTEAVESVTDRGTKSHYEQHQQLVDSPEEQCGTG